MFNDQTGLITLFGGAQDAIQTAAGYYRLKISAHTEAETSYDCEFTVTVSDWCSDTTYTVNGRPEVHSTSLTVSDTETLVLSWDFAHNLLSPPPHENCLQKLQTRFEVSQDGAQYELIDDIQGFRVNQKDGLLFVNADSVGTYRLRL